MYVDKDTLESLQTICDRIGYGNTMEIVAALWQIHLEKCGLSKDAAELGAFAPTIFPFIKKKNRKNEKMQRRAYVEAIKELVG